MISYDFKEGQLVRLFHNRPENAWDIYSVPDHILIDVLSYNDSNGDFDHLPRSTLLEIFLADFIINRPQYEFQ
jgi:hypothetical protein